MDLGLEKQKTPHVSNFKNRLLSIDIDEGFLTWKNLVYKKISEFPHEVTFELEGNNSILSKGEEPDPWLDFISTYYVDRINLNITKVEHFYEKLNNDRIPTLINITEEYLCKEVERKI